MPCHVEILTDRRPFPQSLPYRKQVRGGSTRAPNAEFVTFEMARDTARVVPGFRSIVLGRSGLGVMRHIAAGQLRGAHRSASRLSRALAAVGKPAHGRAS